MYVKLETMTLYMRHLASWVHFAFALIYAMNHDYDKAAYSAALAAWWKP